MIPRIEYVQNTQKGHKHEIVERILFMPDYKKKKGHENCCDYLCEKRKVKEVDSKIRKVERLLNSKQYSDREKGLDQIFTFLHLAVAHKETYFFDVIIEYDVISILANRIRSLVEGEDFDENEMNSRLFKRYFETLKIISEQIFNMDSIKKYDGKLKVESLITTIMFLMKNFVKVLGKTGWILDLVLKILFNLIFQHSIACEVIDLGIYPVIVESLKSRDFCECCHLSRFFAILSMLINQGKNFEETGMVMEEILKFLKLYVSRFNNKCEEFNNSKKKKPYEPFGSKKDMMDTCERHIVEILDIYKSYVTRMFSSEKCDLEEVQNYADLVTFKRSFQLTQNGSIEYLIEEVLPLILSTNLNSKKPKNTTTTTTAEERNVAMEHLLKIFKDFTIALNLDSRIGDIRKFLFYETKIFQNREKKKINDQNLLYILIKYMKKNLRDYKVVEYVLSIIDSLSSINYQNLNGITFDDDYESSSSSCDEYNETDIIDGKEDSREEEGKNLDKLQDILCLKELLWKVCKKTKLFDSVIHTILKQSTERRFEYKNIGYEIVEKCDQKSTTAREEEINKKFQELRELCISILNNFVLYSSNDQDIEYLVKEKNIFSILFGYIRITKSHSSIRDCLKSSNRILDLCLSKKSSALLLRNINQNYNAISTHLDFFAEKAVQCLKIISHQQLQNEKENSEVRLEVLKMVQDGYIKIEELKEITSDNNNNNTKKCDFCGRKEQKSLNSGVFKVNRLKKCSGCLRKNYCSKICQLKHWKQGHKKECKKTSEKIKITKTSSTDVLKMITFGKVEEETEGEEDGKNMNFLNATSSTFDGRKQQENNNNDVVERRRRRTRKEKSNSSRSSLRWSFDYEFPSSENVKSGDKKDNGSKKEIPHHSEVFVFSTEFSFDEGKRKEEESKEEKKKNNINTSNCGKNEDFVFFDGQVGNDNFELDFEFSFPEEKKNEEKDNNNNNNNNFQDVFSIDNLDFSTKGSGETKMDEKKDEKDEKKDDDSNIFFF